MNFLLLDYMDELPQRLFRYILGETILPRMWRLSLSLPSTFQSIPDCRVFYVENICRRELHVPKDIILAFFPCRA